MWFLGQWADAASNPVALPTHSKRYKHTVHCAVHGSRPNACAAAIPGESLGLIRCRRGLQMDIQVSQSGRGLTVLQNLPESRPAWGARQRLGVRSVPAAFPRHEDRWPAAPLSLLAKILILHGSYINNCPGR